MGAIVSILCRGLIQGHYKHTEKKLRDLAAERRFFCYFKPLCSSIMCIQLQHRILQEGRSQITINYK